MTRSQAEVGSNSGQVHLGSGDNIRNFLQAVERRSAAPQPITLLHRSRSRFVPPPGFEEARTRLAAQRTLFLDCAAGRMTAARMLLWSLSSEDRTVVELQAQARNEGDLFADTHIDENGLHLLDPRRVDENDVHRLPLELHRLMHKVEERTGYLVVILPGEKEPPWFPFEWRSLSFSLPAPDPVAVLLAWLGADGVTAEPDFTDARLQGRPLTDIVRIATATVEARDRRSDKDFRQWFEEGCKAVIADQAGGVGDLIAALSGEQRALMLSVAMLHGAHADAVERATALLLEIAGQQLDTRTALEQPALAERLAVVQAELDDENQVRFTRIHRDAAVRWFLWAQMPELRRLQADWIVGILLSRELTPEEGAELIGRFADLMLTPRYGPYLIELVKEWNTKIGIQASGLLLRRGSAHPDVGRMIRQRVYDWSCRPGPSENRTTLILRACEEIMRTHPDEAVVRLHHLVRNERGTRALGFLAEQVRGKRRFLRQVLRRIAWSAEHASDPAGRFSAADAGLFLAVADPEALAAGESSTALLSEPEIHRQAVVGWRLAFVLPERPWSDLARRWIGHAASSPHGALLLKVLTEAAKDYFTVRADLYALAGPYGPNLANTFLCRADGLSGPSRTGRTPNIEEVRS